MNINEPLISIVTVNFNNISGLRETIESIFIQKYRNIEIIVVDGGSDDGSKDYINTYKERFSFSISERDEGVYHAMNRGLDNCKGEWVIFMNSGDCFYGEDTLLSIPWENYTDTILLCGLQSFCGVVSTQIDIEKTELGIIPGSHQAMFFRPGVRYDTRYNIYADYDLFARIYMSDKEKIVFIDHVISEVSGRGLSSSRVWSKRVDKYFSLYRNFGFLRSLGVLFKKFN